MIPADPAIAASRRTDDLPALTIFRWTTGGTYKRGFDPGVSPTIFKAKGLRFFFFSREEERMHVHVLGEEGEAKIWVDPQIEVARNHRLSDKTLATALELIREREDEIRRAWDQHFRS